MKPIFLSLKKQYFLEFKEGKSSVEYRRKGWWTADKFPVGNKIILGCGYSGERLSATIAQCYEISSSSIQGNDGAAVREIYGPGVTCLAIHLADIKLLTA